jgi:coproporphyrinogen III oxidase-like Fe-S oxidoreductase
MVADRPGDRVAAAMAVDSPAALSAYLLDLARRVRSGKSPIENDATLPMVEASAYWVENIEEFLVSRGLRVSDLSPWAAVAMVYSAGLIYE